MNKLSSAAIIVTYNRLELLKICLTAVESQSLQPTTIIIVNNNSTDGTTTFLRSWEKSQSSINKIVINMKSNTGGAGGFHYGIKQAIKMKCDWVWIMDDDVVPDETALENLLQAAKNLNGISGYYSSLVFNKNRTSTVNVPQIDLKLSEANYPNWPEYLQKGIVKIKATTFVSLLVSRESILQVGLPIKEFFIWGDDTEFTLRLAKAGFQGFLIGNSIVRHLRPGTHGLDIRNETNSQRIQLYTHLYKNTIYLNRQYSLMPQFQYIYKSLMRAIACLIKYKEPVKTWVILKGLLKGFLFHPKIVYCQKNDAPN